MRVIVQRVNSASVTVDEKVVGKINHGYMLLVGFTYGDTINNILAMVKKIVNLRIMDDLDGVMNRSILDTGGEILSISQFTLYADTKKGNRPSYIEAMKGDESTILYDKFNEELAKYVHVEKGIFGAYMKVNLENDGPTTIILEK
ncbi:MAG: D-tyrosyl-tRNA(Tyr) deacylase [Bacilli bacterium]|nr:D-tyrosyl-tRNA(Tyr) deacylase [Bacilli bacterium]